MDTSADKGNKVTRRNLLVSTTTGIALALPAATLVSGTAYASSQHIDAGSQQQSSSSHDGSQGENLPAGKQYRIQHGDTYAVVTEEGAGLREFVVAGHEVLDTYSQNEISPNSNGQVLIPFPNRLDGGAYTFEGVAQQLPINEPANNNALHGLTRWYNWGVVASHENSIQLGLILHGQPGYPFVLDLKETYTVTSGVLTVTTTATNIGTSDLPYGVGHHPYLTVGTSLVDPDTLHLPANSYFKTNSRLIPLPPAVTVAGTPYDFRQPHAIGSTAMDTGFADLIFDADGYSRTTFSAPGGKPAITLFADGHHKYLQVYTGDTLSVADERRRSLAIEPYTCAADAFNNGLGLIVLKPGASFSSSWGLNVSL
jgi:aldose 1-epimerase